METIKRVMEMSLTNEQKVRVITSIMENKTELPEDLTLSDDNGQIVAEVHNRSLFPIKFSDDGKIELTTLKLDEETSRRIAAGTNFPNVLKELIDNGWRMEKGFTYRLFPKLWTRIDLRVFSAANNNWTHAYTFYSVPNSKQDHYNGTYLDPLNYYRYERGQVVKHIVLTRKHRERISKLRATSGINVNNFLHILPTLMETDTILLNMMDAPWRLKTGHTYKFKFAGNTRYLYIDYDPTKSVYSRNNMDPSDIRRRLELQIINRQDSEHLFGTPDNIAVMTSYCDELGYTYKKNPSSENYDILF